MTALALDASTARASVAVIRPQGDKGNGRVIAQAEVSERSEHVEPLLPAALALLASISVPLSDLSAIVCGAGPGSFTGLRTAASIAKGLAMGLSIPLYAVPSLPLLLSDLPPGRYVATLDAGRGDRFVAVIDWPSAQGFAHRLVPASQVASIASEARAMVVGPAMGRWPQAQVAARLDWGEPVDLASWEPDYGRDSAAQDRRRAGAIP